MNFRYSQLVQESAGNRQIAAVEPETRCCFLLLKKWWPQWMSNWSRQKTAQTANTAAREAEACNWYKIVSYCFHSQAVTEARTCWQRARQTMPTEPTSVYWSVCVCVCLQHVSGRYKGYLPDSARSLATRRVEAMCLQPHRKSHVSMQISAAFQSSWCGNNGGIASIIFRGCLADLLGRLESRCCCCRL